MLIQIKEKSNMKWTTDKVATRQCTRCNKIKPLSSFDSDETKRSGFVGRCRKCDHEQREYTEKRNTHRQSDCLKKKGYHTREEAVTVAAKAITRSNSTLLRVYHCPHCGSWHLTKQQMIGHR